MIKRNTEVEAIGEFAKLTKVGTFTLAWDPEKERFVFRVVNESFANILGVPSKYIVGRDLMSALPITMAGDFEGSCLEAFAKKEELLHRLCYRYDSGENWLLLHLTPMDKEESFPGLLGICMDVTRILRAQDAISHTDELAHYLATALDRFSNPILIAHKERHGFSVVHINEAFTIQLGYVSSEVVGRDPFFLLFRKLEEDFSNQMFHLDEEGVNFSQRMICYTQVGNRALWKVVFESIREKDLSMSGIRIRLYPTDQSEKESNAVEEILRREDHTKEERIALTDVVNGIANDFNHLLTVLMNNAELFKPMPEKMVIGAVRFCRHAMESSSEIIRDLLTFDDDSSDKKVSAVEAKKGTPLIKQSQEIAGKNRFILVVIGERIIRLMVEDALIDNGFRTQIAMNAQEALELLKNQNETPDLVVIDRLLPDKKGLELVRELRNLGLADNFMIVTSYMQDAMALEMKEENLTTLFKPFAVKQLLAAVSKSFATRDKKQKKLDEKMIGR